MAGQKETEYWIAIVLPPDPPIAVHQLEVDPIVLGYGLQALPIHGDIKVIQFVQFGQFPFHFPTQQTDLLSKIHHTDVLVGIGFRGNLLGHLVDRCIIKALDVYHILRLLGAKEGNRGRVGDVTLHLVDVRDHVIRVVPGHNPNRLLTVDVQLVGLTAKEGANALLGIPGGDPQMGCVIFLVEVTHGLFIPLAPTNE